MAVARHRIRRRPTLMGPRVKMLKLGAASSGGHRLRTHRHRSLLTVPSLAEEAIALSRAPPSALFVAGGGPVLAWGAQQVACRTRRRAD
jgi:hypothetical protein